MKLSKRILLTVAALVLFLSATALPAQAADWRTQYTNMLTSSAALRRVALCDLTSDSEPELAVLTASSTGETALAVYTANGSGASEIPLSEGHAMTGVKSASMQWRKAEGGAPMLVVILTGANISERKAYKLTDGTLKLMFTSARRILKGKAQYTVNGTSVSKSKHNALIKAFDKANKKASQLPMITIKKGDSRSVIQTRFKSLATKHAKYGVTKTLKLSKATAKMNAGGSLSLGVKRTPATAFTDSVEWITTNENIATVDASGRVKAIASGSVKIYARTLSGMQKACTIAISGPKPTKVNLSEESVSVIKGGSAQLAASYAPQGATASVKWASSKTSVATVSQTGTVTAKSSGTATITVTTDNGLKATCKIEVVARPAVVVDISQHEYKSNYDWAKIAKSVDLMILRCGVTRTDTKPIGIGKDDKFAYYAQQCQKYSIPFGVYYYGKSTDIEAAKQEAQMTWDVASPYNPLFYVYDVEESRLTKAVIETYIKTLKSLGAKKTGYYIAHHLYSTYKLDTKLVDFVWIPHYGKNTGQVVSTPSYACDLHQYTSVGRVDGIPVVVDISRLMGSKTLAWYLKR